MEIPHRCSFLAYHFRTLSPFFPFFFNSLRSEEKMIATNFAWLSSLSIFFYEYKSHPHKILSHLLTQKIIFFSTLYIFIYFCECDENKRKRKNYSTQYFSIKHLHFMLYCITCFYIDPSSQLQRRRRQPIFLSFPHPSMWLKIIIRRKSWWWWEEENERLSIVSEW